MQQQQQKQNLHQLCMYGWGEGLCRAALTPSRGAQRRPRGHTGSFQGRCSQAAERKTENTSDLNGTYYNL